jgi:glycosyl transferase family 87
MGITIDRETTDIREEPPDRPASPRRGGIGWTTLALSMQASFVLFHLLTWAWVMANDWFPGSDFSAFYTGWTMVLDGRGAALYDLDLQGAYQERILGGRFEDGVNPYNNPPHMTLPFAPLAWLPRPAAVLAWTAAQAALLIWVIRWLLRGPAASWRPRERLLLVTAVLAFPPLMETVTLGSFSLLMLACLAQSYAALKRGRDGQAGVWLVIGSIKPQLVMLPGLMLLAGRRWRALAVGALVGGALALVATLALGPAIWRDYLTMLGRYTAEFDRLSVKPQLMWNLRGTLTLLLGREQAPTINLLSWVGLLAAAGLTLWLWRGPWRTDWPRFDLRLALTIVLTLLFAPHFNHHDGMLLVLPAVILYGYLRPAPALARLFAALALTAPLFFFVADRLVGGSLGVRVPALLMVGLALWLAAALRRTAAPNESAPGVAHVETPR